MTYCILWIDGSHRKILYSGIDKKRFELLVWRNTSDIVRVDEIIQTHGTLIVQTAILTVDNGGKCNAI